MTQVTSRQAKTMLDELLRNAAESHHPIRIVGKASAVLISEDDWRSIQETLYLLSVPGMRRSIRAGLKTPVSKCAKKVDW